MGILVLSVWLMLSASCSLFGFQVPNQALLVLQFVAGILLLGR